MNKRICAFVLGCTMTTTAAFAADMKYDYPEIDVPLTPEHVGVDWEGFYAGFNLGYGIADELRSSTTGTFTDLILMGEHYGIQAGYNFQNDQLVFGLEASLSHSEIDVVGPCGNPNFTCSASIDTMATLEGRLGVAVDNYLLYGTAGLAYGFGRANASPIYSGLGYQTAGYTLGAGVELAVTDTLSARVEYKFVDFNTVDTQAGVLNNSDTKLDVKTHLLKVGMNYHF